MRNASYFGTALRKAPAIGCDTAMNRFKEAPSASQLRAVKQGRLIALDQAVLSSVGEPMLDVAEQLTKRLWGVAESPAKAATPTAATQ